MSLPAAAVPWRLPILPEVPMSQLRRTGPARFPLLASIALAAALLWGCQDGSSPSGVETSAPRAGLYNGDTQFLPVDGGGGGGGGGGGSDPSYQSGSCGTGTQLKIQDYGQTNPFKSGTSLGFAVSVLDANGCEFIPSGGYKWTVDNSQVVYFEGSTTASTADLRAKLAGYATVKVTWGTLSRTLGIQVVAGDPKTIVVTPSSLSLQPGGSAQLTGAVYDWGGNKLTTQIAWNSNNTRVKVVSTTASTALVSAVDLLPVAPNPATITAGPGAGGTVSVTVTVPQCYCPPGVSCTCAPL